MKERPISFNDEMVRAILDGRKTVTRRPLKVQPIDILPMKGEPTSWITLEDREKSPHGRVVQCRYGQPGDRLWVRETWAYFGGTEYLYQQDINAVMHYASWAKDPRRPIWEMEGKPIGDRNWRPSIHMPRWASRITLEVTGVRVERLCRATQKSLMKEGLRSWVDGRVIKYPSPGLVVESFAPIWESIYAKKGLGWDKNPWVWVIEFRRAK